MLIKNLASLEMIVMMAKIAKTAFVDKVTYF